MTNYKQLCADLVAWAEKASAHYYSEPGVLIRARTALAEPEPPSLKELVERARAALAEPEPEGPTDEELLRVAAISIEPYESSGISLGEYEAKTECALEVYGSELIGFARAVLARWGK